MGTFLWEQNAKLRKWLHPEDYQRAVDEHYQRVVEENEKKRKKKINRKKKKDNRNILGRSRTFLTLFETLF